MRLAIQSKKRCPLGTALLALAWLLPVDGARAGGSSVNLFLVVNANSQSSRTIANHYIKLRQVPAGNVLYLDWKHDIEKTDIATFRTEILGPSLAAIKQRGLAEQIDYLIYSSDLPWRIDAKADFAGLELPPQLAPRASLNGVTYLWQIASRGQHDLLNLKVNQYVQRPSGSLEMTRTLGLRSWYGWKEGKLLEAGGSNYLLSTMLAVTSGRGTSVDESIEYLTRSAAADGTSPGGTIYLMKNNNVRSRTRHPAFEATAKELRLLGVKAEILDGTIPQNKDDVAGAVVGTANFDWDKSGSTILPGAICEHLTSAGGVMFEKAGQTPLTEFLKHGAAGASGTVTEPYAIQDKFPLPTVQVHYARGASLAEAFYQSVAGPYQLLIVGDPLCQPWAKIPRVELPDLQDGQQVSGPLEIAVTATGRGNSAIGQLELYVDGRRTARSASGESFTLDTTKLADGYHELRVIAIDASPVQTQGSASRSIRVDNHGGKIDLEASVYEVVAAEDTLQLRASSAGAAGMVILQNNRTLGRIAGSEGTVSIKAGTLGRGPVRLRAVALGSQRVFSKPLELTVK